MKIHINIQIQTEVTCDKRHWEIESHENKKVQICHRRTWDELLWINNGFYLGFLRKLKDFK